MKPIYLKSELKCDSFDVAIDIKTPFFRILVTIEPGRSLLQFVTTNCLRMIKWIVFPHMAAITNMQRIKSIARNRLHLESNFMLSTS